VLTDPAHPSAIELPVVGASCVRTVRARRAGKAKKPRRPAPRACASLPVPDMTRAR
jgi:hypothetical protein